MVIDEFGTMGKRSYPIKGTIPRYPRVSPQKITDISTRFEAEPHRI
jgi:hypothetical protein